MTILYASHSDAALLSTVEELQSSLDRANEKLQYSSSLMAEKDKEITKLSKDVDTVSWLCCHDNDVSLICYSYVNSW